MAHFYDRVMKQSEEAILDGGFAIEQIQRESMRKAIPITRPTIRGIAVRQSRSAAVNRWAPAP